MIERRYDLRSYEMVFPRELVQWFEAVNQWTGQTAVIFYLTHYYFMIAPGSLLGPGPDQASLRYLMSEDFLPPPEFGPGLEPSARLAPGPDYLQPVEAGIGGVVRRAMFQHAPSMFAVSLEGGRNFAGYAALAPWAWESERGDGLLMQLSLGPPGGRTRLAYSRYLDPRLRAPERAWLPLSFNTDADETGLRFAVLPGPLDDPRSDFGLWADFHDPAARAQFERRWALRAAGPVKCYENRSAPARLRAAGRVETVSSLDDCLAGVRAGRWGAGVEVVVDETGREWPGSAGRVLSVEWGANRIEAEVELDGPGALVLADTWYPGWIAEVGGEAARVYRGNCAFRAVRAPAGRHRVVFRFEPVSFRIGLWCGLASWTVLVAGGGLLGRARSRRRSGPGA